MGHSSGLLYVWRVDSYVGMITFTLPQLGEKISGQSCQALYDSWVVIYARKMFKNWQHKSFYDELPINLARSFQKRKTSKTKRIGSGSKSVGRPRSKGLKSTSSATTAVPLSTSQRSTRTGHLEKSITGYLALYLPMEIFIRGTCATTYGVASQISKKIGVLGTWTRGGRMEGADESTELWRHP